MNTLNRCKTGCYLLKIKAFRLRSQKTLEEVVFNGPALPVESFYNQSSTSVRKKEDIFVHDDITLSVSDSFIRGKFVKMKDTRTYFYLNPDNNSTVLTLMAFEAHKNQNLDILEPLFVKSPLGILFTFAINTVLPNVDMVSAKIMST